jgi:hypothetical protein
VRRFLALMLLSTLALPAFAAGRPKSAEHHARMSLEKHFTQANLSHNGHLTLHEATTGYPQIAKHFDAIDAGHKGYVTEDDIRAWRALRKASHKRSPAVDAAKPMNAVQSGPVSQKSTPAGASVTADQPAAPTAAADKN